MKKSLQTEGCWKEVLREKLIQKKNLLIEGRWKEDLREKPILRESFLLNHLKIIKLEKDFLKQRMEKDSQRRTELR